MHHLGKDVKEIEVAALLMAGMLANLIPSYVSGIKVWRKVEVLVLLYKLFQIKR
jgi:hypothetical protein